LGGQVVSGIRYRLTLQAQLTPSDGGAARDLYYSIDIVSQVR
jgi:hypothetical protein